MSDDRYIGQRIREYRRVRGYSQKHLADLLGVSRTAVTMYETGERPVDSRALLYGLAQALQVSVGDLTRHAEDKTNPTVSAFHAAVPRIESALMTAGRLDDHIVAQPLPDLVATADQVLLVRMANDYSTLGQMLPDLLSGLYHHTASGIAEEQTAAWRALTKASFCTALATKGLGYTSLAWNAAQVAANAAAETGDAAGLAAAEFVRSQVLLSMPGAINASLAHSAGSADRLQTELTAPQELELYGMLHLQAALTAAAVGKDPQPHLDEATETAVRSGAGHAFELDFGPNNVNVWRMSVALEQRQGGRAIEVAQTIQPEAIDTNDRRCRFFIELGRAHALEQDYGSAMHALLRAEHVAPQQVRSRTVVRELVGHMLRKARRDLVTGDLGRLAQRVGAVPA